VNEQRYPVPRASAAPKPTIGRIVLFRSRTGGYTVPAIITATTATLAPKGVEAFEASGGKKGVPPLSGPECVHLTVFTPGLPGQRAGADDFLEPPRSGLVGENVAGTYQEWDVSYDEPGDAQSVLVYNQQAPGTWRWPTRDGA
jgi:hypothetical protein